MFCIFLLLLAMLVQAAAQTDPYRLTKADIDRWMKELSNWGRWGEADQLGTVNLITPAKRKQAVALVREGYSVSLARDVEKDKAVDNPQPFEHKMVRTGESPAGEFAIDSYSVLYHGYAHTHMDALCHMFHDGKMYNGFPKESVTQSGARKLSVVAFKQGILTRGILLDIPVLKGVPYLEPSTPVYPEDLEAWEKKAGLKIASGDVVFLRTGRWVRRAEKGPWPVATQSAGFHASSIRWLHQRDVAMVGSDAASDVMPSLVEGVTQPVHLLLLVAMGTPIFDNCDLEALSKAAGERHRWEFLLTASPMAIPAGTGSPLNPIATF